MAGVNKVILLGNLGKDPEVRTLESGSKVANFSLATNRFYKGQDGQRMEETEWHNVVLWGVHAELAEKYLNKGNKVFIEGRIKTRSWDDKEGVKHYITEIIGESLTFVGGKPESPENGQKAKQTATESLHEKSEDDLPF